MKSSGMDRYLLLLVALTLVYLGYWLLFASHAYSAFDSSYFDIGITSYVMYLHVHSIQLMGPLQYLVFFNHISPFSVLLVPIFALYQQPIMLIAIQDAFLAATTILAYFVALQVLNDRKVAFALGFAFLINPGLRALFYFNFHPEAFIPFFCILSFYFYFKGKRAYFAISLIALLSVMETAYAVAAPLLLGLLVYELLYNLRREGGEHSECRRRIGILLMGIVLTAIAFLMYHMASAYISGTYSTVSDYAIPPITRIYIDFIANQLRMISNPTSPSYNANLTYLLGGIGTPTLVLGFGASSALTLPVGIIFYLPWLFEVFVVHNWGFASFSFEYYAYVIGGSFIAGVLGFRIFLRNKILICKRLGISVRAMEAFMFASILIFSALFSVIGLTEINIGALTLRSHPNINYTGMSGALATIPANASVLAQAPIATHLFYIHNLELPPIYNKTNTEVLGYLTVYWFVPDYIVIDRNLSDYYYLTHYNLTNSTFNVYQYMGRNYTVYYNDSDLYIYKRVANTG